MPFTAALLRCAVSRLLVVSAGWLVVFAVPATTVFAATGSIVSATVADRYLVVYRDGKVPTDVETRISRSGGRLVSRHDRFGMVAVVANAAGRQRLQKDAAVEYVVQDRVVVGTSVLRRNAPDATETLWGKASQSRSPLKIVQAPVGNPVTAPVSSGPGTAPGSAAPGTTAPVAVTPGSTGGAASSVATADTFYSSTPQGWAVKAAGGFGYGVAGGTTHGAWDTTRGTGVRIAVLDSGVDASHPDIAPNLGLNLSEVDRVCSQARATTARRRTSRATAHGRRRWRRVRWEPEQGGSWEWHRRQRS